MTAKEREVEKLRLNLANSLGQYSFALSYTLLLISRTILKGYGNRLNIPIKCAHFWIY